MNSLYSIINYIFILFLFKKFFKLMKKVFDKITIRREKLIEGVSLFITFRTHKDFKLKKN